MANIIEALQDQDNRLRISAGNRWLCGNGQGGWIVYERKPYAKNTATIIDTSDEHFAVKHLLEVEDEDEF